jgi:hypothetical protein
MSLHTLDRFVNRLHDREASGHVRTRRQPILLSAGCDRFAEHEAVAIGRAEGNLAHAPRFILRGLQNLGARSDGSSKEGVNVIDLEIRDVAVIAEFACGRNIWTAPEHELHVAGTTEAPVAGINVFRIAPEDVAVPGG